MGRPATTVAELAARIRVARETAAEAPEHPFRHALRGEAARLGGRGNGGPGLHEPEPRMLRYGAAEAIRLGEAMFGSRWKAEVADVTGEHSRELRRWASGDSAPCPGTVHRLRQAALRRREELDAMLAAFEAVYPPPLPPPAPEPEVVIADGVDPEDAAWFLDTLARALTPGRPTFVRQVLSARRPPRGRHWTADVIVFDGARHTLACDRGADLEGTTVGLAWTPGEGLTSRQPCILWDDAAGWVRGADFVRGHRPRPAAAEPEPAPAPPARPADPQVDLEEWLAGAGLIGE